MKKLMKVLRYYQHHMYFRRIGKKEQVLRGLDITWNPHEKHMLPASMGSAKTGTEDAEWRGETTEATEISNKGEQATESGTGSANHAALLGCWSEDDEDGELRGTTTFLWKANGTTEDRTRLKQLRCCSLLASGLGFWVSWGRVGS
ncbi:hypothetical protein PIB30_082787 [Stylosanthes scabra]|uniref:Uncharacterized protein n=1 Tax=Stylosanthes scabra TaxID=79078 RepID=A0ABU6ZQP8_9FABA|nr:hypothetical protein [Stylosanthes scabra]